MSAPARATIRAHGKQYRILDLPGLGAGYASSKVWREAQRNRAYEHVLLEHIWGLHLRGRAIDVGANVGNHSLWMAAICGLRVEAFEPVCYYDLIANRAANGLQDRIGCYEVALGDVVGWASHRKRGRLRPGEGDIEVRTLDGYGFTDVELIKIDVEGMESYVLRGGETTIRRDHPIIFAEEWDDDPKWHQGIADVLEPWGYRMRKIFRGRESPTPVGEWVHRDELVE